MTITTRTLDTLTDTITTTNRLEAAFDVKRRSCDFINLLVGLRDSRRAFNIIADHKRAVFDTPGRGRVSVTCSVQEDVVCETTTSNGTPIHECIRVSGWEVIATHPNMGVLGDIHFCISLDEILAIVEAVSC